MAIIKCCRHCEKRCVGCHSVCKEYLQEKTKWEAQKIAKESCEHLRLMILDVTKGRIN